MMDVILRTKDLSLAQVGIYATLSFIIVSLFGVLMYITCSKRYKLNWFEKNLLETATAHEDDGQSQEALVGCSIPYNIDSVAGSNRSLNRLAGSPNTNTDDPSFWVPHSLKKQTNNSSNEIQISSADESMPASPTSPTSSHRSIISTASSTVPIARTDKHVVLSISPARPKVSSMQAKLDHTKIDTSLYKKSISRTSSETDDLRGTLHLIVSYDPIAGILCVRLIEAQDLQPRDFSGTADPYAKIRLLPDKTNIWQTRIHKRTLNPVFDEDFVFEERPAVIGRRTLEILLYDFDAYSRHVSIGGAQIALAHIDLAEKVDMWKPLVSCGEQDARIELGDLMVSLSYLPSAERLTVVIIKARNLRVVDDTRNSSDPYVKVTIINCGKKFKKRKTGVLRNTLSPVFNEALTFDIAKDTLKNSIIEFVVLHDSLLGSNEVLGKVLVGNTPEIRIDERGFFEEMFRTKTATAQWISLVDPITP